MLLLRLRTHSGSALQMAEKKLDCRGLACPHPVLKTKETIESGDITQVNILVDNAAARENVGRFLERMGYTVTVSEHEGSFEVAGSKALETSAREITPEPEEPKQTRKNEERKIAVLVGTECMGSGDDTLGRKLLINFVGTLKEMGSELWRLIFLNGGVKLTVEGSESLPILQELEKSGVYILVCGTCLNHFELLEKKKVGETTNMLDIVTALQLADKVISFT
ncbi:hypothetical protein DAMNIGENAA_11120 [Desulforhabdus amnigena]|uniref:UPF0033 domain-containing protein n=2 Tax=Desulforhabdus amnigena TaxID=40218 RepID=A0A9W6FS51_9BACT|nr:hypothetical protein DAMNIGENAA_11120 [Desulforhabdus amnigena]